ncbi:EFR1 family ferrodoxin [Methanobacterium oryzae]|uniref:EFR1 family ferrodoxin n=1 Tax=Methanobacterium oryzae TaxID=69540 RepID=UPI003D24C04B
MNAKLFYFSGTGNSLAVTRKIAKKIEANSIYNMADSIETEVSEDIVGFIFPVYFQDVPEIVKDFINKIEFKSNPYIFGIATCNGGPGFTLFNLDKILKYKGQKLSSGFTLTMPGNSVIILDLTSNLELQKERLQNSKIKLQKMSEMIIKQLDAGIDGENKIKDRLEGFIIQFAATKIYRAHKKFTTNEKCVKCGICYKICPENNINVDKKVNWGNSCNLCLACFHWCPQNGIELGNSTKNRIRYHHPDIIINDMILR